MSDAATPAENNGGTPPASPAATPAPAAATPPADKQPEKVTLTKEEHDQLVKDAARAASAQSSADRYKGILQKNGLLGNGHFKGSNPATPPTPEELQAAGAEEDRKAERGLMGIALDPIYREVLDKDPTLRNLLTVNPLAVLPILAPEALDADDALALVKEELNKRKTPVTPPATPATPPADNPTPPAGGVNPADKPINEEVELARKNPNTEQAVAGMIGANMRAMKK